MRFNAEILITLLLINFNCIFTYLSPVHTPAETPTGVPFPENAGLWDLPRQGLFVFAFVKLLAAAAAVIIITHQQSANYRMGREILWPDGEQRTPYPNSGHTGEINWKFVQSVNWELTVLADGKCQQFFIKLWLHERGPLISNGYSKAMTSVNGNATCVLLDNWTFPYRKLFFEISDGLHSSSTLIYLRGFSWIPKWKLCIHCLFESTTNISPYRKIKQVQHISKCKSYNSIPSHVPEKKTVCVCSVDNLSPT